MYIIYNKFNKYKIVNWVKFPSSEGIVPFKCLSYKFLFIIKY